MIYDLPESVEVGGREYKIRSDFRPILDICVALNDPELSDEEKAETVLEIFYPDADEIPPEHLQEALNKCFRFINGGEEDDVSEIKKPPRLEDWEQDFPLIVAPVNKVLGYETRAVPYDPKTNTGGVHWLTFLSAFNEVGGDCTFAQVVAIRSKLAKGKKLDKSEKEWLKNNRKLVDFKRKYTEKEDEYLKQWL